MYRVRDFAEERSRTLYVRLPHRIRNTKEVQELFEGDAKVKLPRQASRACHVIFPNVEEKIKGLESIKEKTIDGKRIVALNPRLKPKGNKVKRKKIVVPKPKAELKITQTLFVSNIKDKTSVEDLRKAFPGSTSIAVMNLNSKGLRSAFVKMESYQVAGEYLRKERKRPVVNGNVLSLHADTRVSKRRRGAKSRKLEIHNEDGKPTADKSENLKKEENVEENSEANDDSESESDTE